MADVIGIAILIALPLWGLWRLMCWFEDSAERAGVPRGLAWLLVLLFGMH